MENLDQTEQVLGWESYSHQNVERSDDWFWGLGVIAVATVLISLVMGNILLALIIGLAGFLLYRQEREPVDPKVLVKITKQGVRLNNNLYTYEKIRSFWVEDAQTGAGEGNNRPARLILHYRRVFVPNIHIPIIGPNPKAVRELMLKYGEEERHVETFTEQVFDLLGF